MPDQAPTTPLSAPADEPVAGATLVIEAPSAEEALTQLHEQLGADARIVEVRRVARGGVAGFFARELVELHAAPGASAATPSSTPAPAVAAARPAASAPVETPAASSPIDRLLRADEQVDDTIDFATYLRNQLSGETAAAAPAPPTTASVLQQSTHEALLERATAAARLAVRAATGDLEAGGIVDPATDAVRPTTPAAPVSSAPAAGTGTERSPDPTPAVDAEPVVAPEPAPAASLEPAPVTDGEDLAEPAPSTEPGPAWSVANLIKLGLPAGLVRGLAVAPPADDVAWTTALATALRPVCRPLPSGPSLLVGPRARAVATKRNLPLALAGDPIRSEADVVAVATRGNDEDRRWIERARGSRWLHVVAGGSAWRDLLQLDPLAVSWATRRDLPEAVRLATELGLVLGAGPLGRGVQRARPMDVALAIRAMLPVTPELATGDGQL